MKILITEQLSKNKYKDNSGYLICKDAILARTGTQQYLSKELFKDGDDTIIEVDRPKEEVLNEKTIASFENKPVTDEHPDVDVVPLNCKDLQIGFARDIHAGVVDGQDVILGTLVITDANAIEMIENGEKVELSCGYDCDIMRDDKGNYYQANIRGNHIALCEAGRAGIARIVDSKTNDYDMYGSTLYQGYEIDFWDKFPGGERLQERLSAWNYAFAVYNSNTHKIVGYTKTKEDAITMIKSKKFNIADSKIKDDDITTFLRKHKNDIEELLLANGNSATRGSYSAAQYMMDEWESQYNSDFMDVYNDMKKVWRTISNVKWKDSQFNDGKNRYRFWFETTNGEQSFDINADDIVAAAKRIVEGFSNFKYFTVVRINGSKTIVLNKISNPELLRNLVKDSIEDANPDIIAKLIADEEEAIRGYEKAIEDARDNEDEAAIARYQHILEEEMEHIQELKDLLANDPHKEVEDSIITDRPADNPIRTQKRNINMYGSRHNSDLKAFQTNVDEFLRTGNGGRYGIKIYEIYKGLKEDYEIDIKAAKNGEIDATKAEVQSHYDREVNKWIDKLQNRIQNVNKLKDSAVKDAYKNPFRGPSNQQVGDDAYYGFNDATAGYYDKWYRYNRKDNGKRYDEGVKEAMKQGATIEHYIEEPRAFDSLPKNIQYSKRIIDNRTIFDLKIDGKYVASFDSFNTMIFYISKYSK